MDTKAGPDASYKWYKRPIECQTHSVFLLLWLEQHPFTMESTGQDQTTEALQQSDNLPAPPAAKPNRPRIHKMAYTYVHYKPIAVSAAKTTEPQPEGSFSPEDVEEEPAKEENGGAAAKQRTSAAFWFINRRCTRPIMLFGNQMFDLADELPNAYEAYQRGDTNYRFVLSENKDNLTTLEVFSYNGRLHLSMKKYFKARLGSQMANPFQTTDENGWIPTRSYASFDPARDDPQDLIDFVVTCCH